MATPLAGVKLGLRFDAAVLVEIDFLPNNVATFERTDRQQAKVVDELSDYFSNPLHEFGAELAFGGTPFQQRVWRALRQIKPGCTLTYGELAKRLKTSARAVGNACRANPLPIIVPCHRVVSAAGIGGYMGHDRGDEINIKRWLLQHEGGMDG